MNNSNRRLFVVMLNGHAGCLKTTLSYLLATALEAGHVSTSLFGPIVPDRASEQFSALRDKRYSLALATATAYLQKGTSIVVDGTFALRRWRESLYRVGQQYGAEELVAVNCGCSDVKVLEERFRYRASNLNVPDATADSMNAYLGSVAEFEELENDDVPPGLQLSVLSFDSCTGKAQVIRPGQQATVVAKLISLFGEKGMLARPLFSSAPSESRGIPMVLLEGIGGSGKSTQTELLCDPLRKYFGMNTAIGGEFSSSPLGRFIDRSRGQGLRVSPVPDPLAQNFLVMTDLMSCFLDVRRSSTVYILDSGILGRLAHLSASRVEEFPPDAWSELVGTTSQVLERLIIGDAHAVSIFLDCPVDLAIERLESRGERLTSKDYQFLHKLNDAFRNLIANRPDVAIVNAAGSRRDVTEQIIDEVRRRLGR